MPSWASPAPLRAIGDIGGEMKRVIDEWRATLGPDDIAILGPGVGVGLRKGDEALKARFNEGIAKVRADSTYMDLWGRYFKSPPLLN